MLKIRSGQKEELLAAIAEAAACNHNAETNEITRAGFIASVLPKFLTTEQGGNVNAGIMFRRLDNAGHTKSHHQRLAQFIPDDHSTTAVHTNIDKLMSIIEDGEEIGEALNALPVKYKKEAASKVESATTAVAGNGAGTLLQKEPFC